MDYDTNKMCEDLCSLEDKDVNKYSFATLPYTLGYRAARKLRELSEKVSHLEHQLLIAESQADAWNKAFIEELRMNVALKAQLLKDEVK